MTSQPLRDPAGQGFHALITARATHGPSDARGIIGHAWSPDLGGLGLP